MTEREQVEKAKEKVLAVYPDSKVVGYHDGATAIFSESAGRMSDTGYIGWGQTAFNRNSMQAEREAWIDAASRLSATAVSQPVGRQVESQPAQTINMDLLVGVIQRARMYPPNVSARTIIGDELAQLSAQRLLYPEAERVESGDGLPTSRKVTITTNAEGHKEVKRIIDQLRSALTEIERLKGLLRKAALGACQSSFQRTKDRERRAWNAARQSQPVVEPLVPDWQVAIQAEKEDFLVTAQIARELQQFRKAQGEFGK